MKTEDLIDHLAATASPVKRHTLALHLGLALVAAACVALVALLLFLGLRHDLPLALGTPAFWLKAFYTASMGGIGVLLTMRLIRPGVRIGPAPVGAAMVLTLGLGVLGVAELAQVASDRRLDMWLGSSWSTCPFWILGLSAPLFLAGMGVLRRTAPTSPGLAGLAMGLAAGGLAATVYGLHCRETAAAFVATWYAAGMLAAAGVGALIGRVGLRW